MTGWIRHLYAYMFNNQTVINAYLVGYHRTPGSHAMAAINKRLDRNQSRYDQF